MISFFPCSRKNNACYPLQQLDVALTILIPKLQTSDLIPNPSHPSGGFILSGYNFNNTGDIHLVLNITQLLTNPNIATGTQWDF